MGLDQREKLMLYKEIVEKISVGVEKKLKQKEYLKEGLFEVVDQGQSLVGGFSNDSSLVVKCDLPVIVFGDHTKCVKFIDFPFIAGADGVKVLRAKECVDAKFLYYYTLLLTKKMIDKGYARHYQFLEKMEVEISSIDEQRRIVNKIEELFSELDSAVETLKKTKEQLAVYRQSVLKSAFEKCEESKKMGDVAIMIDPHPSHRTPPEFEKGIPYIGVGDIDYKEKSIKMDEARKVNPSIYNEHIERYTIHAGDFIMGKIGTIGKPYRLPLPQNYVLSANVILIQPNTEIINPEYLFWQFSSPLVVEQLMEGKNETSQPAFGIQKARLLNIKMCDYKKQNEIVQNLRLKMSVCDNIEKTVNDALIQADAMRQSILKKAFEGDL